MFSRSYPSQEHQKFVDSYVTLKCNNLNQSLPGNLLASLRFQKLNQNNSFGTLRDHFQEQILRIRSIVQVHFLKSLWGSQLLGSNTKSSLILIILLVQNWQSALLGNVSDHDRSIFQQITSPYLLTALSTHIQFQSLIWRICTGESDAQDEMIHIGVGFNFYTRVLSIFFIVSFMLLNFQDLVTQQSLNTMD